MIYLTRTEIEESLLNFILPIRTLDTALLDVFVTKNTTEAVSTPIVVGYILSECGYVAHVTIDTSELSDGSYACVLSVDGSSYSVEQIVLNTDKEIITTPTDGVLIIE